MQNIYMHMQNKYKLNKYMHMQNKNKQNKHLHNMHNKTHAD